MSGNCAADTLRPVGGDIQRSWVSTSSGALDLRLGTTRPSKLGRLVLLLLSSVCVGCVGWLTGGLPPGFVYLTLSESYSPFGTPLVFEMGKAGAGIW